MTTLTNIRKSIFPYGNNWMYPLFFVWFMSIAIIYNMLPAMLLATSTIYAEQTGAVIDFSSWLMKLSPQLFQVAFRLIQVSGVFMSISCVVDILEYYVTFKKGWL